MSRAYRIEVAEGRREIVRVADGAQCALEILEILPPRDLQALLRQELLARGFSGEGAVLRRQDGEVQVEVDVEQGTLAVRSAVEKALDLNLSRSRVVEEEQAQVQEQRLRVEVQEELAEQLEKERAKVQAGLADRLEAALRGVQRELDQVVQRVTVAALKQKAAQLGEVQEVSEDPQTGALTIKVKV